MQSKRIDQLRAINAYERVQLRIKWWRILDGFRRRTPDRPRPISCQLNGVRELLRHHLNVIEARRRVCFRPQANATGFEALVHNVNNLLATQEATQLRAADLVRSSCHWPDWTLRSAPFSVVRRAFM